MQLPVGAVATTDVTVRFSRAGFHRWPEASGKRSYLSALHRHLFKVEVSLEVHHEEREVEFHDLLEWADQRFRGLANAFYDGACNFQAKSCETLARELTALTLNEYPGRRVSVTVWEDGEVGSTVRAFPEDAPKPEKERE